MNFAVTFHWSETETKTMTVRANGYLEAIQTARTILRAETASFVRVVPTPGRPEVA